MRLKTLLKTMLLLCALIAGSVSMWAAETTYNFSSIPTTGWSTSGGSQTINSKSWTYSSSTYIGGANGKIQIGSKNNPQTSDWTIQTSVSNFGTNKSITAVSITAYTTAATATYAISVGGTLVKSGSLTTSSATYSATGLNVTSGDIIITLKGSSTSKAMYLSNISVTYDDASSDPSIGASNQEIAGDATSGEFSYTILNPVDGKTLSASVTSGETWLSNPIVDAVNNKVTFTTTQNPNYSESRQGTIRLVYGDNLATKDVTITQAASIHKYVVTIETPSNGTLVVKNGETTISNGDELADGTTLTITATPVEGYRLRNWQAVDASTHTYTSGTTYTINAHEVTIKANFEVIPEHKASFYINGTKNSEADVKEGSAITFPVVNFAGVKFLGWTTAAIDGTQTSKPATLVTQATMGEADVDYYAVFGSALNAFFDAADVTDTPQDGTNLKWTHTATGIYITLSAGQRYTSGTPNTFTITKGTSNYLQVTAPGDCILDKIEVTISGTSYKINSVQSGASLSTSSTTQTVTFTSDKSSIRCYATSGYQIRATTISVKAFIFCTTIPPVTATVGAKGYATMVNSEHALDFTGKSISAYIVKSTDGSALTLTKVNKIAKNTPVLLYSTTNSDSQAIPVIADSETMDDVTGNKLVAGTGEAITWTESTKYYVLNTANTPGFYKANESPVATNKAYLDLTGVNTSRSFFTFDFDNATAIENVNLNNTLNGEAYDLQGRRVATPQKGLYIVNGRKVVIK